VFDFLRKELLESLEWRQRLPPLGVACVDTDEAAVAACLSHLAQLGRDLARRLASAQTARDFLAARGRQVPGHESALDQMASLPKADTRPSARLRLPSQAGGN
jgi:hypothetical protein